MSGNFIFNRVSLSALALTFFISGSSLAQTVAPESAAPVTEAQVSSPPTADNKQESKEYAQVNPTLKDTKKAQDPGEMDYSFDQSAQETPVYDPLEPINRQLFRTNQALDNMIFRPLASFYVSIVPKGGREKVGNFLTNISSPVTFANSVLQGNSRNAMNTLWRFLINSTLGIGGLFDPAAKLGVPAHKKDFGQTLGVHKVGPGPYLVVPVYGPSSARDATGLIADALMDPFNYINSNALIAALYTTRTVHYRSENLQLTDDINKVSLDPYATYRSAYTQRREAQIKEKD